MNSELARKRVLSNNYLIENVLDKLSRVIVLNIDTSNKKKMEMENENEKESLTEKEKENEKQKLLKESKETQEFLISLENLKLNLQKKKNATKCLTTGLKDLEATNSKLKDGINELEKEIEFKKKEYESRRLFKEQIKKCESLLNMVLRLPKKTQLQSKIEFEQSEIQRLEKEREKISKQLKDRSKKLSMFMFAIQQFKNETEDETEEVEEGEIRSLKKRKKINTKK
ncbi:tho complex subunit 7 [Anaeramoeba flamelloides]|uniref:Tho complex subunit 7 n=1 Tax=Anaeramoeba flamelloides TaxID=1746091 RepID=A0AAV7YLD6_9EUKA|nr:tho complex subunit 7 [Anaeramoeba flamelloides]